jgi:hypothetical protein
MGELSFGYSTTSAPIAGVHSGLGGASQVGRMSKHPEYVYYRSDWDKCRDVYYGSRVVKERGEAYLPRLSEQSTEEYNLYKDRALFFSILSKTISAFVGMVMTRPPALRYPPELAGYFEDNDEHRQFYEVVTDLITELLITGRAGVMVDAPIDSGVYDIVLYNAESVINWGKNFYVLEESYYEQGSNFAQELKVKERILLLNDGVYQQVLASDGSIITPTIKGRALNFIPFQLVTPTGMSHVIQKPPLLDIVDINISHYRTSADLEHGRHFTGLPTPVLIGADANVKLRVGSTSAWVLPDVNSDAKYLEFTGVGLGALERALVEKQTQMASLSARMLDNSRYGSEAVDTVRLRYMSEVAGLTTLVRTVESVLTKSYRFIAESLGANPDEVYISFNKDFLDDRLTTREVLDLVSAYQTGGINAQTLVYNLKRGDVLSPEDSDLDIIDELERDKEDARRIAAGNGGSDDGDGDGSDPERRSATDVDTDPKPRTAKSASRGAVISGAKPNRRRY